MTALPTNLEAVFTDHATPEAIFEALLPQVCDVLNTDRCFLEVRQPDKRLYRVFCWRRKPEFPDMTTHQWQPEKPWELEDPLYAAALRAEPSIYVEDVETAGPEVLNLEFEHQYFGHRALIHAHILDGDVLWGILQPCLFHQPRLWSDFDHQITEALVERLKPWVIKYGSSPA